MRKPTRERIEAILGRDCATVKLGDCGCRLTVTYDDAPDGSSLDEEFESLYSKMFNIAENYRYSTETDVHEIGAKTAPGDASVS